MRRYLLTWSLAACIAALTGCNNFTRTGGSGAVNPPRITAKPTAQGLVAYLNRNAEGADGLYCGNVVLTASSPQIPTGSVTLHDAKLFLQKPRNFRLIGQLLSNREVDLGSNSGEFWWWIKKDQGTGNSGPLVYHCSYDDLEQGRLQANLPFHPDMVLAGLGIASYDPNKDYEVKVADGKFELIEETLSPMGQKVDKVVVFDGVQANTSRGQPQILAHILRSKDGKEISKAEILTVQQVRLDNGKVAVLPKTVKISWPEQKLTMKISLTGLKPKQYSERLASNVFNRRDLASFDALDIATGQRTSASGIERAGGQR